MTWFDLQRFGDDLTLITEPCAADVIRCNIWHLRGRDRDLLIDTGLGLRGLVRDCPRLFPRPPLAVATHAHYDHVGGLHEFDERYVHAAEASLLREPGFAPLQRSDFGDEALHLLARDGIVLPERLISAPPYEDFEWAAFKRKAAPPTHLLTDGDAIDLGDRAFEILHLPGHSPGSIGVWDPRSGTLFAGDAVYEGDLLDQLPGSDIGDYLRTMRRLLDLPVEVVHPGHGPSFGRRRLREIATSYISSRGAAR